VLESLTLVITVTPYDILFPAFGQHITAALPPKKRRRKVRGAEIMDEIESKEANVMDTAFIFDDGQDFGAGFNMDVDVGVGLQGLVSHHFPSFVIYVEVFLDKASDKGEIHLRSSEVSISSHNIFRLFTQWYLGTGPSSSCLQAAFYFG
jgi:hypothetical protein